MNREMPYALVTGASQGLGKAFVYELANRHINVLLVGLPDEHLEKTTLHLRTLGCKADYFETDLTQKQNIENLAEWVNTKYNISILINNAGCGGTKDFMAADINYLDRIIQLNVMAPALLTRLLLPNLMKQEQAYVLNVSSMAAFSPIGYKTVYPASKSFVHRFTRGLHQEFANTNVFFSVVHPGPMKTNNEVSERIEKQGLFGKIGLLSPERVAEISIRQLFKKDSLIILNRANGIVWLLMFLIPIWIRLPLLTRGVKRELNLQRP